jgi:oligopeptide transport system substrate-binding protein
MIRRCAAVVILALLAACGRTGAPASSAAVAVDVAERVASKHLRRQIDAPPTTLDPALSLDVNTGRILEDLFEGLVRQDGSGAIVPAVASRWDVSADGLTWTFHLVPDARWSNGEPVTAGDFVYAWRRLVDPATASQSAQQAAPIVNALDVAAGKKKPAELGVRAVDAQTLEVRLVAPTPYFLALLTNGYFMPLNRANLERFGTDWTRAGNLVSDGAFVLEELRINGAVQLKRSAYYRDAKAVRLERVTYFPVGDRAAATSRYLAGDVDVTEGFPVEDVDWLKSRLGGEARFEPYFGTVLLKFNVARPPFDSRALRLAMSLAVDRDVLTSKLLHGIYLPAYNVVPPLAGYPQVLPDWAKLSTAERHARARELYAEAGYNKNHPLEAELSFPITSADSHRVFEAIVAMWRANLGAEVHLGTQEWRVHQQNRHLHLYALFFEGWIADYPDPLTFLSLFQHDNGNDDGQYFSPRYEQLVGQAMKAGDQAERYRNYVQAEQQLNDDAPFVPIYFYESRHLVRSYVKGWQGNVMDRNASRDLFLDARPGS